MLVPAILFKDEIKKKSAEYIYSNDMFYYTGCLGNNLINIPENFDGVNYHWAIINENKELIGYFRYSYYIQSRILNNFGLITF